MDHPVVAPQVCVLKMSFRCEGFQNKVKKKMQKVHGVHSINIDANEGTVTISSTGDPHMLKEEFAKMGEKAQILWQQRPISTTQLNNIPFSLFDNVCDQSQYGSGYGHEMKILSPRSHDFEFNCYGNKSWRVKKVHRPQFLSKHAAPIPWPPPNYGPPPPNYYAPHGLLPPFMSNIYAPPPPRPPPDYAPFSAPPPNYYIPRGRQPPLFLPNYVPPFPWPPRDYTLYGAPPRICRNNGWQYWS